MNKRDYTVDMKNATGTRKTVPVRNCSSSDEARQKAESRNPGYKAGSTTGYMKNSNAFPNKTKFW